MNLDIQQCLAILKKGGVILYPTDTIWGLGADGAQALAIDKIIKLKQRSKNKSMILLFASWEQVERCFGKIKELVDLAKNYQDKPTTFVFFPKKNPYPYLTAIDGSVAIRITAEKFSKSLCLKLNSPLISTSANLTGKNSPIAFTDISPIIKQGVDYIVKYRQKDHKPSSASRIIKLTSTGETIILRD